MYRLFSISLISFLFIVSVTTAFAANNALDFDGTNDYVEVTGYTGISGTNSRTIEAWIKTTDTLGAIVAWGLVSDGLKWTMRTNSTGVLRVEVEGGYILGTTNIIDDQWHHVACTFENDGSPNVEDVLLYVDGLLESTSVSGQSINTSTSSTVRIGKGADGQTQYFDGQIDEVRIWSVVRSQADLADWMNLRLNGDETGLEAYYNFNQGTAGGSNAAETTLTDDSGNNRDGTLTNFTLTGSSSNWVTSGALVYDPVITIDDSDFNGLFVEFTGSNSAEHSYTVSGDYLGEDVVITAPTDFEISTTSGSGFGSSISLSPTNASVANTTIYVRYVPSATGSTGSLTISHTSGITIETVDVEGIGASESSAYNALDFDGTDDYVEITGYTGIDSANSRTIEAWIKTTDTEAPIVSWGTDSAGQKWVFRVQDSDGTTGAIRVEVNNGYVVGSTVVTDNIWHHVACTFESDGSPNVSEVLLYVDGQLESPSSSSTKTIDTDSASNVGIGSDVTLGNDRYFEGSIDEVRIWSVARSQTELEENMYAELSGSESGLEAYYPFNQGTAAGTNSNEIGLVDVSANGHGGELANFALTGTTW